MMEKLTQILWIISDSYSASGKIIYRWTLVVHEKHKELTLTPFVHEQMDREK